MAGHSKWKNIRIRKGKQDAIKGKQFTKLSREIIVAARAGGGDAGMNPRLRVAVEKARAVSMPVDNIKRAIQRGTGEIEGADYEELTYEGRGPGGAAIIMECYSENRNRTVADIRHAFSKNGGRIIRPSNFKRSHDRRYVTSSGSSLSGMPDFVSSRPRSTCAKTESPSRFCSMQLRSRRVARSTESTE